MHRRDFIKGLFGTGIVAANADEVYKSMMGLLHDKSNNMPAGPFGDNGVPVIKIIGVGGIGCRAVNAMMESDLSGIETVTVDASDSAEVSAQNELEAFENNRKLRDTLSNANLVFVIAGADGKAGLCGASVIAGFARKTGAMVVCVIAEPINFEGKITEKMIFKLNENTDALIVLQKDHLINLSKIKVGTPDPMKLPEQVLMRTVKSISDVIITPGFLNVDFADIKHIMSNSGRAIVGMGLAKGEHRARQAARMAITSHLLSDGSIKDARGVLINITGNEKMSLTECNEACAIIKAATGRDADVISGYIVDPGMQDELLVTVVTTGLNDRV